MNHPDANFAATHTLAATWRAHLKLRFADRDGRTVLAERRHCGPLLVQKPLYPEGRVCHVVMLHPPAGIAGGDELAIDVDLESGAHATLTTPGATRWYKSLGREASQCVRLEVGAGARLDWLPQENIVFKHADALVDTQLRVAEGGSAIGWDVVVLGRRASGEGWSAGRVRLRTTVEHAGRAVWIEAAELDAGSPLREARVGMDRFDVLGTLWAVGAGANQDVAERIAATLPYDSTLRAGVSCLGPAGEGMLLLRVLGEATEAVRQVLVSVWTALRQPVHGVPAKPLRLWAT
ncbi:MAG: urease accessory protein UreD [Proteobacteria bacterium]|nr:urease accessory protein UreD [Pseudomonadota bacterium]